MLATNVISIIGDGGSAWQIVALIASVISIIVFGVYFGFKKKDKR